MQINMSKENVLTLKNQALIQANQLMSTQPNLKYLEKSKLK